MVYKTEAAAIRRIEVLRVIGVWPGYYYSRLAGGWVLTYDPPDSGSRSAYDGEVLV